MDTNPVHLSQISSVLNRPQESTRQPYNLTTTQKNPIVGPGTYEPRTPTLTRSISISSAPRKYLLQNKTFTAFPDPQNTIIGPGTYTPKRPQNSNFALSQTSRYQYKAACWSAAISGEQNADPNPQTYQKVQKWRAKSVQISANSRNLTAFTPQERMAEKHKLQKNYTPGPGHFSIRNEVSTPFVIYKNERNMDFKANLNPFVRGKPGNDVPGPGSYDIRGMCTGGFRVNRGVYMSKFGRGWEKQAVVKGKCEKLEIDY